MVGLWLGAPLGQGLADLPIVGDVRGDGFFYGIELVKDLVDSKETFNAEECERLIRGFLSGALFEAWVCTAGRMIVATRSFSWRHR